MAPKKTSTRKTEQDRTRAKENHELKQEVRHHKKQVARLRKQLERSVHPQDVEESPPALEPEEIQAIDADSDAQKCQACGSYDLTEFKTPGGKKISACRTCKTRR